MTSEEIKLIRKEEFFMSCTTILAGKKATYDGSTFIARNDDSPSGVFNPKKWVVVQPSEQPRKYKSVNSHVEIELPDNPMKYTAVPNVESIIQKKGIWAASGANEANVAMTATETITSNERVLGADPLVTYEKEDGEKREKIGGIGEEDIVVLVLPYIRSAREGVLRLGELLEKYGTYEMNGIAFQDKSEVWWLESIGGHHWIAKRVPDDSYVIMPNQLGIDNFDLKDAFGAKRANMCSEDLREFISDNHLDLSLDGDLNPRDAFGSHDDADHVYNTPRAWFMGRYLNHKNIKWDGLDADFKPDSDDIPWSNVPDKKITVEDVKYLLSSHYQGTPFDPYAAYGDSSMRGAFRSIGINRNDFVSLFQIRPYTRDEFSVIEWLSFSSNAFNAFVPFYTNISETPDYLANTTEEVSTDNFYWSNRLIAALSDAHFGKSINAVERYQSAVQSKGHELIKKYDKKLENAKPAEIQNICEKANSEMADVLKAETQKTLSKVLYEAGNGMKNCYARSDS